MTIDDGAGLKAARNALGLSLCELADRLRLRGGHKAADHLREIEEGKRELTGPIAVAVELLLYARELELELGINADRNAAIARIAGEPVDAVRAPLVRPRNFSPRGD